ncbi:MAG: transposase [Planctomycetes bacterium]|nr:transposase [Planctomycetota bacterium]
MSFVQRFGGSLNRNVPLHYRRRRPLADGRRVLVLTAEDLLGRLSALVPPPRFHTVRYHGVYAPNARLRRQVVSGAWGEPEPEPPPGGPVPGPTVRPRPRRLDWASLLKRVFALDVLECERCGGALEVIAYITDRPVVRRILCHLELPSEPPPLAPQGPLQEAFDCTA